jgi:hypothetical protein
MLHNTIHIVKILLRHYKVFWRKAMLLPVSIQVSMTKPVSFLISGEHTCVNADIVQVTVHDPGTDLVGTQNRNILW